MNRNYGIDLLRIISMLMVVSLHILGHGGVLESAQLLSARYDFLWFIEIMCYCAVNCYVLISGYVGHNLQYKFANIVVLWLRVVIISVVIAIIMLILYPSEIGIKDILLSFVPVLSTKYWFFTAYFGLFLFMPLLNVFINKMPRKQVKVLILIIILFLSVFPTIRHEDIFGTINGYSMLWFIVLYIVGAYIGKYNCLNKLRSSAHLGLYFVCVVLTWGSKLVIEMIIGREGGNVLVNYSSPTVLAAAVFILLFFARIKVDKIRKMIAFLAPLSFSVYLIHDNAMIRDKFITGKFVDLVNMPPLLCVAIFVLSVIVIYIVCSFIDLPRELLFKKIALKKRLIDLENKVLAKLK